MINAFSRFFNRKLPVILQAENMECGLACITMVMNFHGNKQKLAKLRTIYPASEQGMTVAGLTDIGQQLGFVCRGVKLELEEISNLQLPCIIHWNFNHFVVLESITDKGLNIHDPQSGRRHCKWREISESFTGVALEIWPGNNFKKNDATPQFLLFSQVGNINGIKKYFFQIVLVALILELFTLLIPLYMQWVLDKVIVSHDRSLLSLLAFGFLTVTFAQQFLRTFRGWVLVYIGTTFSLQWRTKVFSHLVRLPLGYFARRHFGDIVSRFNSVDVIQRTITGSFVEAIIDGIMTMITLALIFSYSLPLTGVVVLSMFFYLLSRMIWYNPLREATERYIGSTAKQQSHFLETLRGIKTIKLFQTEEERSATWSSTLIRQLNADVSTQRLQLLYRTTNALIFGVENILVIYLGAMAVISDAMTTGAFIAFLAYRSQFNSRVTSLIDKIFDFKMLGLHVERLADILLTEIEEVQITSSDVTDDFLDASITFKNVFFRYGEKENFLLKDVSFNITDGESVAIAGPSGQGKSTIFNILLGIFPTYQGMILVGGIDLKHVGIARLRKMVGTVLQDDVLFAGSIADNISFFAVDADFSWLRECAVMASIDAEIMKMPLGYSSKVGDMGTILSGGQKQRVLLARALYKRPRILLLDEATSHLDLERETEVSKSVHRLNITRIIIAHRPQTIASAQRLLILKNGSVTESQPANFERNAIQF